MESWEMFIDFGLIAGMSLIGIIVFILISSKLDFSRKLLIVFFMSAFFFLMYYYGFLHRSKIIGGIAVLFGHGNGFLLGPTLYILLKSYYLPKEKLIKPYLKSLIPFFLFFIVINIPFFIAMVFRVGVDYHKFMVRHDYITITLNNLFFLYYLFITKKQYVQLKNLFEENYSTQEVNNLRWLEYVLNGFIIIIIADNFLTIYELIFPIVPWNIGTIMAFMLIGFYGFLGYKGMFQSHILILEYLWEKINTVQMENPIELIENNEEVQTQPKVYAKQLDVYSDEEIQGLKKKLNDLLEIERLYTSETISLTELADKMGISSKKLSELLNQHLASNFYNLINEYRVNEVKKRIIEGEAEKYNLLSIAFDSGFQSKASFNRIFKQKVGVSPSEFVKQIQQENTPSLS